MNFLPDSRCKCAESNRSSAGVLTSISREAASKVIILRSPALGDAKAKNHRYLFADFLSSDEARRAVKATDGKTAWGVQVRVRQAIGADSRKPREREEWDEGMQCELPY